ncbi:MAG: hypothetical protein HC828_10955 [Blastochloris sp.]|nr:hypothetical protein [Blastochloris sp.]
MPQIFELFGFPITDRGQQAEQNRKEAQCPFMNTKCDGGGNRHQTKIRLDRDSLLRDYFDSNLENVIPGICSITAGGDTWVVCPRRLFAARNSTDEFPVTNFALQSHEKEILLQTGLPQGVDIGVWSEVYLKQQVEDAEINYHFDYIAMPLVETTLRDFLGQFQLDDDQFEQEVLGFSLQMRKRGYFSRVSRNVADTPARFPVMSQPFIFEVMTASTSGSDTENETDIRSAFRNAILNRNHESPGINKRQVWGRMVTQLFAKTALANAWGGQTLWVIQDELLRNIELTTLLRTSRIARRKGSDINLVVMKYIEGESGKEIGLKESLSGDSGLEFAGDETFTDILLPKVVPSKFQLARSVLRRSIDAVINI